MPSAHDEVAIPGPIISLGSFSSLNADVTRVCPAGSCQHTSIQAAIDASSDEDTIVVAAGTYNEIDLNTLGKAITISGETHDDGADLTMLLGIWGPCPEVDDCPADLDGNGIVVGADLTVLLGRWGACQ